MNCLHDGVLRTLVDHLLKDVYYPFSLCVWLDEAGRILELRQFDTAFFVPEFKAPQYTVACWLISNHPDGDMCPCEEDVRNCGRIRNSSGNADFRFFIASEDEGILEIAQN